MVKEYQGPYFYNVEAYIGNDIVEHSIIKIWNVAEDDGGNKVGNYSHLSCGEIYTGVGVNLTEFLNGCSMKIIHDNIKKAKLLLRGL